MNQEVTGLAAIAREADLYRELADIRGKKLASPLHTTRYLNAREDLVLRRLRHLGVDTRTAAERFQKLIVITHDEARAVRALICRRDIDPGDAHVLGVLLGRMTLDLDGPGSVDDDPTTRPA